MPAIECQNCQTLIEYWPRHGSFQVSCVRCKRLTTVSGGTTVPERTARASKPSRPSITAPPKWANARLTNSYSIQMKLFAAKVGNLARTAVAYTVAVGLLAGLALAFWSVAHPKELQESTGITVDSARTRILDFASAIASSVTSSVTSGVASDIAAANSPRYIVRNEGAAALNKALAIPKNQPFVRWLKIPTQEGPPPEPKWVQLGFSSWEDHSNRKFFDKGKESRNDDPPMKYQVNVRIDAATAEATEHQFGRPANADPPTTWAYDGDGSREAVNRARESKAAEIAKCHGYREEPDTFGPDYEWLIARSQDACERVAPAVVQAVTGKKPDAISVRQRVEALASFVQNAIPYTYEVDEELQARHRDGARRMGIRPPATALLRGGDCDTKSLLLAALIRSIDRRIPLALIDVKCKGPRDLVPVDHVIVGVGDILTKPGEQTRTIDGVNLLLIETTHGSFDRNNPFDWDLGHTAEDTDWNGSKATWISGN